MGAGGRRTLSVVSERGDGATVIRVEGDLDVAGVPLLREHLEAAEDAASRIVVDLRRLSFLDSTGLHSLLLAGTRARRNGHRLALRRGPRSVHRLFILTRADRLFDFVE